MIDYEEDWLVPLIFRVKGSVAVRSGQYAVFAAIVAVLMLYVDDWYPGLREDLGLSDVGGSQIWNAATGVIVLLCNFRQQQGLARFWEGTGLLHQMRGEWFDTVSNCVTFSIAAKPKMPVKVMEFRHSLVRLMSLCHGSALEEITENTIKLPSIDTYGLDDGTLNHLRECHEQYQFNKVEVMLHLVQSLITKAHYDGVLTVPPPIVSRVYQTISRGFVNLLNAKKITDTRFPFPYVQLIVFLLSFHCFLTPMIITAVVKSKILAAVFSFIPIFGMFSLNFIAVELENPFGTDDNDLPMSHFQDEMNSCLLMLLHDNTDMISGTSPRCLCGFHEVLGTIKHHLEEDSKNRLSAWLPPLDDPADDADSPRKEAGSSDPAPQPEPARPPAPAAAPPQAPAEAAPAALPPPPAPVTVDKGIEDFITALDRWSAVAKTQVTQLDQSFHELKRLGDTMSHMFLNSPEFGGFPHKAGGGWELAISPV
mmetsp:Transcript_109328/g.189732  ORF Transcript_109328/g.189732 Transcript_109328/m.189732 type:complete len:480 (-) Transcript_109328:231-1670(-)